MQGLSVMVYRTGTTDCTNGGVTRPGTHLDFAVFDKAIGGNLSLEKYSDRAQSVCLRLVRRTIGAREYIHAEPMGSENQGAPMFGGNFIYTTDSRFRNVCPYPIPVHDRFENRAE